MFRFENLQIWQLAVQYGKECYIISRDFPKDETYALQDQLRRAAISISNNIAEGSVGSKLNFKKYLNIAIGSIMETVNILNFAYEINYIDLALRNEMYEKAEALVRKARSFSNSLDS